MTKITAHRYHDISCGHRVVGHEGKCRHLHGHNYRIHFFCEVPALDDLGRVIDFGVIKAKLCQWLEDHWDHHMLLFIEDPWLKGLQVIDESIVVVPFNPTAENIGSYLVNVVGPMQLQGTGVTLTRVIIEETRKCGATIDAT
jgi:6-pyruvoyltetrahydropterin/6-carboxytetrahydropterin synthase